MFGWREVEGKWGEGFEGMTFPLFVYHKWRGRDLEGRELGGLLELIFSIVKSFQNRRDLEGNLSIYMLNLWNDKLPLILTPASSFNFLSPNSFFLVRVSFISLLPLETLTFFPNSSPLQDQDQDCRFNFYFSIYIGMYLTLYLLLFANIKLQLIVFANLFSTWLCYFVRKLIFFTYSWIFYSIL